MERRILIIGVVLGRRMESVSVASKRGGDLVTPWTETKRNCGIKNAGSSVARIPRGRNPSTWLVRSAKRRTERRSARVHTVWMLVRLGSVTDRHTGKHPTCQLCTKYNTSFCGPPSSTSAIHSVDHISSITDGDHEVGHTKITIPRTLAGCGGRDWFD
ncbi:hypothetical protein ACLOJK_031218 [Asimina triloba]